MKRSPIESFRKSVMELGDKERALIFGLLDNLLQLYCDFETDGFMLPPREVPQFVSPPKSSSEKAIALVLSIVDKAVSGNFLDSEWTDLVATINDLKDNKAAVNQRIWRLETSRAGAAARARRGDTCTQEQLVAAYRSTDGSRAQKIRTLAVKFGLNETAVEKRVDRYRRKGIIPR